MGRYENVAVFEDTEKLCKTDSRLKESVRKATENQRIILESDTIKPADKNRYKEVANVVVSKKKTLEASSYYQGEKVAIHNFASATNPGGGVTKGSTAQEECICRCTGLYFSLNSSSAWNSFYTPHRSSGNPIHNADIIYTPSVTVFKTDTAYPKLMREADWYDVDVITCAAPNLREKPHNQYNSGDRGSAIKISDKELLAIHEERLRRILDIAASNGVETIILGAFGCGAFKNKPEVVALAAKNVLKDYMYAFKNIEFAVYCSHDDDINFRTFSRVLGNATKQFNQEEHAIER